MLQKVKIKSSLYFLIILIVLFFITSCVQCGYNRDKYKKMFFKGVILKKYQDKNAHMIWKLLIKEQENEFEFLNELFSDSYLFAEPGDSIIKIEDSLKITIIKRNGEKRDFRYDYE